MSTELIHKAHGDILYYAGDLPHDAFIRVPPGAIGWRVSYQSYKVAETARMVISTGKPAWQGVPLGSDSRNTLRRLLAGETLEVTAPPDSGGMDISTYQLDMPAPPALGENVVFLNSICIPGNRIIRFESTVYLDAAAAPGPSEGQIELARLVNESGLANALRSLFPGQRDEAIVKQCDAAGYTAALTKLIAMARGGA